MGHQRCSTPWLSALYGALALGIWIGCVVWVRSPDGGCSSAKRCVRAFEESVGPKARFALAEKIKCLRIVAKYQGSKGQCEHLGGPAPGQGWLAFYEHGDAIYRFVSMPELVVELPPLVKARVDSLATNVRDELEFGKSTDPRRLWRLSRRAYAELFGGAGGYLSKAESLVLLPDGLIRFIPLHALVFPNSGDVAAPRFVIQRWSVSYLLSAAFGRRPKQPKRSVAFLPSYGHPSRPLAGALVEASAIRAAFSRRGLITETIVGEDATAARILRALKTPEVIVHFAGHGHAELRPGHQPELLLTDTEHSLELRHLLGHRLKAPVAILAGCTTGYVARFRDNEARVSESTLVAGLLVGGVGTVVAASWAVKDRQSARQMATFYQSLHLGPAEALAMAQRERILRLRPPHPRYWAFYGVFGAPRWR